MIAVPRERALVEKPLALPLAWHAGRLIGVEEFLSHANGLAEQIPDGAAVINLCDNRYHFLVAFAAALLRGMPNLLPPSAVEAARIDLQSKFPRSIICTDRPLSAVDVPVIQVDLWAQRASRNPLLRSADCAAILFTSGSSGAPVAQSKSWGALCGGSDMNAGYYLGQEVGPWSVVATVPPQHMYGLETSIMPALQGRVTMHAGRPFFPLDVQLALSEMPAPRLLVSSPLHLRALVRSGVQFPPVARVLCATAALDQSLAQEVERVLGAELVEIYGSTEAGSMASRRAAIDAPWRFFAGMEPKRDGEQVRVHAAHNSEPVTLSDLLEFATDGSFRLGGRLGDMVKVGGKRTTLAAITQCLMEISGVDDAVAFQVGAAGGDTRVCALVVAAKLDAESIRTALRSRLDPVFVPRQIHLVNTLPRNATGKLTQLAVAELAAQLGITATEP